MNGNDFQGMLFDKLLAEGDEGFDGLLGGRFPMAAATDFNIRTVLFFDLLERRLTNQSKVTKLFQFCLNKFLLVDMENSHLIILSVP